MKLRLIIIKCAGYISDSYLFGSKVNISVRAVAFLVVWGCSKGVYHFWLLPNINDDRLGVIETFKPLYSLVYP